MSELHRSDDAIAEFLRRSNLVPSGHIPSFQRLSGGVSSDIWLVRAGEKSFCVKRPLPRLRVATEWQAPTRRGATEVAWLRAVKRFLPDAVPAVLAHASELGMFAMEYLPPDTHEDWKKQLSRGEVDLAAAAEVGSRIASIHSAFSRSQSAPGLFATDDVFHSLRIEPYFLAAAEVHPNVAPVLGELAEVTAGTKITVVHGDVSPKNILLGPRGPAFLDAECAWYGDPAFDLGFCLTHLLLKSFWVPSAAARLTSAAEVFTRSYLQNVDWESGDTLEERASRLLPALMLARIDGRSPVEYLNEISRDTVRRAALSLLVRPTARLSDLVRPLTTGGRPGRRDARRFTGPRIARVAGRRVWDSRGRPTVEAEVVLSDGAVGRAIAPAGASVGTGEAVDLRDGGSDYDGMGVDLAVINVQGTIASALRGMSAIPALVDARLVELDGTSNMARLGGNATTAVSMATLHAAAASEREPLWRYLAESSEPLLPMPMIQIFGGGVHAGRRIDIQDFLILPIGAATFHEAISMSARVYAAAGRIMADRGKLVGVADEGGWWPEFDSNLHALDTLLSSIEQAGFVPGTDVSIALDVAASQLRHNGHYVLRAEGRTLDTASFSDLLVEWCLRYPIISVEDPHSEDDVDGMLAFTARMGDEIQIIGDDFLVTSADRIVKAAEAGACNAVLLKPNQAGTITRTADALAAARAAGWSSIISARSGESEDVTIAHLAVGWGVGQLKVGSFSRSERMAKWNEVIRIEEALGASARFAGASFVRKVAAGGRS